MYSFFRIIQTERKNKEEKPMKKNQKKNEFRPAFATKNDPCYFLSDLINGVLTVVTGIGAVTVLTFLLML